MGFPEQNRLTPPRNLCGHCAKGVSKDLPKSVHAAVAIVSTTSALRRPDVEVA
jgi:hypothetical protein